MKVFKLIKRFFARRRQPEYVTVGSVTVPAGCNGWFESGGVRVHVGQNTALENTTINLVMQNPAGGGEDYE